MACSSLRASSRRTTRRCPAPSLPLPASVPDTWSLQPRQRVVYQGTTLNCGESLQRARTGRRGMRRRAPSKRDVGRGFVGSTLARASAGDIQRKKRTVSHTHITSQPTVSISDRATHRHGGFTAGTNGCALALDREPAGGRRRELPPPVRRPTAPGVPDPGRVAAGMRSESTDGSCSSRGLRQVRLQSHHFGWADLSVDNS